MRTIKELNLNEEEITGLACLLEDLADRNTLNTEDIALLGSIIETHVINNPQLAKHYLGLYTNVVELAYTVARYQEYVLTYEKFREVADSY